MNVILIGMKHCGKTTLGAALAARWGCPFYDVDQMVEEHHACAENEWLSVREIFSRRGADRFQELETKVVCDLYLRLSEAAGPHVVAVGGRTVLNEKVGELLGGFGVVVYLEVSPEEMFQRVLHAGLPPFVNQDDPVMHFLELYQERIPHYQRLANLTVNVDGLTVVAALDKLCRGLQSHEPAGNTGG